MLTCCEDPGWMDDGATTEMRNSKDQISYGHLW